MALGRASSILLQAEWAPAAAGRASSALLQVEWLNDPSIAPNRVVRNSTMSAGTRFIITTRNISTNRTTAGPG